MDKVFDHKTAEKRIYDLWESSGCFEAKRDPAKKPFTIILPPPNASGKMHTGNVLMIAIEDLLIRWKRMKGFSALWIPGTDHAGFETQTTFERQLKKEGKSRFDFDRNTLYKMIWDFVQSNKSMIEQQMRFMGASVDWSRYKFTLDPDVLKIVYGTFEKLVKDGHVYRNDYIVNYSPYWGTTFSDAEIQYAERKDPLYYIKYGPLIVATVRPETMFGDTAVAVNPDDERYQKYIGKTIEFETPLGKTSLKVIADSFVDTAFGTGVVKITPAHDKNDYEVGLRHKLEVKSVIGLDGRMNEHAGKYTRIKVAEARKQVVADLQSMGMIDHIDEAYTHLVPVDYRGGFDIENLILPNWFVKVEDLKKPALEAIEKGEVTINPKWREVTYVNWMKDMRDWPISRQVVWGIRIPAWYDVTENPQILVTFLKDVKGIKGTLGDLLKEHTLEEIKAGLQTLIAPKSANFVISQTAPSENHIQETDTFDTWFSSGQWPIATLGYPDSEDFKYFYPTSVLETGWEIVTRWVSRMIMFGYYLTGKSPFSQVYLHGTVKAPDGRKMSKSLGNVVNPEEFTEQFGVDALRMGLVSGTANGKDFAFPKDRVLAYRNFGNKIWNMARFMLMMFEKHETEVGKVEFFEDAYANNIRILPQEDLAILTRLHEVINSVDENMEKFRFADAADNIYQFMWKEVADVYIENVKNREDKGVALSVLCYIYKQCLIVLHPFMPFVTEEIWSKLPLSNRDSKILAASEWPSITL